jgi:SAM-dependent methyltransferase
MIPGVSFTCLVHTHREGGVPLDRWNQAIEANKALWNELTAVHAHGETYQMTAFKDGTKQLDPLVRMEVGEVAGRSLLHLQCHFGMDTLMWARLGAQVTGIDLSDDAIALARALSREVAVPATFVQANVYDLPVGGAQEQYDIVYTSWGVLCWLPDLTRWGQIIARSLKPGGFFYIAEAHPLLNVFDSEDDATGLHVRHPYYHQPDPTLFPPGRDYADQSRRLANPSYEWAHSVGEIQTALIDAGLRIDFFHEHPYLTWNYFPFMVRGADGYWRLPPEYPALPLSFSLKATKPELHTPITGGA